VHFVNSKATSSDAIPLLFLHGWPGSFMEVMKALPALNEAGFNVVAPSLLGYGFSTYPDEAGFNHRKHAEVLNALMLRLGYDEYVVQGGDWGSEIARTLGLLHPEHVKAVHQNMVRPHHPCLEAGAKFHRWQWQSQTSRMESPNTPRANGIVSTEH